MDIFGKKQRVYCKYCGMDFPDVRTLTVNTCQHHPAGRGQQHHELYEGSEKSQYACKYSGILNKNILEEI